MLQSKWKERSTIRRLLLWFKLEKPTDEEIEFILKRMDKEDAISIFRDFSLSDNR